MVTNWPPQHFKPCIVDQSQLQQADDNKAITISTTPRLRDRKAPVQSPYFRSRVRAVVMLTVAPSTCGRVIVSSGLSENSDCSRGHTSQPGT